MAVSSRVQTVFSANSSGLVAATRRASTAMEQMQRSIASLNSSMRTLVAINGAQLFGSIVSYASQGASSMTRLGQTTAETIDRMSKLAFQTGTTYAEFAGLAYAGNLAGVTVEELSTALSRADRVFVNAQNGSKAAQEAFAAIGVSVDSLATQTSAERFESLAAAIIALPDPAQRAAAAMSIFGRAGVDLLPMMAQGADGIRQAREEFERFGGALTNTQATNVEAMNDAWTRVKEAITGVVTQVVANLAPAIQSVYDTMSNLIAEAGGASIGQYITDAFFDAAETLAIGADYLYTSVQSGWEYASGVIESFGGVTTVLARVSAALEAVFFLGEAALKGIAAVLARSASGWAYILDSLPDAVAGEGWAEFARSMEDSASRLSREADAAAARAIASGWEAVTGEVGDAYADAVERPVGVLQEAIKNMRQAAEDAANAPVEAAANAVRDAGAEAAEQINAARRSVTGVDARSAAGITQIVDSLNSATTREELRIQRQQLDYLRRIALEDSKGLKVEVVEV